MVRWTAAGMESLDGATTVALLLMIAAAAALYSSVGHGGASGYLAAMALLGLPAVVMKPAALAMNIAVSGLVGWRLYHAGHFRWHLFWPFAASSVPLAFAGGWLTLPGNLYRHLVAVALLIAASRLFMYDRDAPARNTPPLWVALPLGAAIGLVSGLTGVGGGIFLSPLLLLLRWADMRTTAALSAVFIFVNSIAGLAGHGFGSSAWPAQLPWMMLAAVTGAVGGSELAVRRLAPVTLRRLLGVVLVIAVLKLALA